MSNVVWVGVSAVTLSRWSRLGLSMVVTDIPSWASDVKMTMEQQYIGGDSDRRGWGGIHTYSLSLFLHVSYIYICVVVNSSGAEYFDLRYQEVLDLPRPTSWDASRPRPSIMSAKGESDVIHRRQG